MSKQTPSENIVIKSSAYTEADIKCIFEDEPVYFAESTDLAGLMKELGIFKSTSQARQAGRQGDIPSGYTHDFKASKKRRLFIWNPTE